MNADASYMEPGDDDIKQIFKAVAGTYASGSFKDLKEAKAAMDKQLKEKGLIK